MPLPSDETTPPVMKTYRVRPSTVLPSAIDVDRHGTQPSGGPQPVAQPPPLRSARASSQPLGRAGLGAQHARELVVDLAPREPLDARHGRLAGLLHDPEVPVGERRDLRQVRDAHDLRRRRERSQLLADRARRQAADAGVDLVEDERPRRLARRAPPRGWPARCATARRRTPRRPPAPAHARVGRHEQPHGVAARTPPACPLDLDLDSSVVPCRGRRGAPRSPARRAGGRAARGRQRVGAGRRVRRRRAPPPPRAARAPPVAVGEAVQPLAGRPRRPPAPPRRSRGASASVPQRAEAGLDRVEPRRVVLDGRRRTSAPRAPPPPAAARRRAAPRPASPARGRASATASSSRTAARRAPRRPRRRPGLSRPAGRERRARERVGVAQARPLGQQRLLLAGLRVDRLDPLDQRRELGGQRVGRAGARPPPRSPRRPARARARATPRPWPRPARPASRPPRRRAERAARPAARAPAPRAARPRRRAARPPPPAPRAWRCGPATRARLRPSAETRRATTSPSSSSGTSSRRPAKASSSSAPGGSENDASTYASAAAGRPSPRRPARPAPGPGPRSAPSCRRPSRPSPR